MSQTLYPFPANPEDHNYRLFPDELENNERIFFHGTNAFAAEQIIANGFKFGRILASVSFDKNSALALRYACEARNTSSPEGCVLAVQYEDVSYLEIGTTVVHDYKLDPQPIVIGYCIVPASYNYF